MAERRGEARSERQAQGPEAREVAPRRNNKKRKSLIYIGILLCAIVGVATIYSAENQNPSSHHSKTNSGQSGSKGSAPAASATAAKPLVPVNAPPPGSAVAQMFKDQEKQGEEARQRSHGSIGKAGMASETIVSPKGRYAGRTNTPSVSTGSAMARSSQIMALQGRGGSESQGQSSGDQSGGSQFGYQQPGQPPNQLGQLKSLIGGLANKGGKGSPLQQHSTDDSARQNTYQHFLKSNSSNTMGGSGAIPVNPPMSGYVLMPGTMIPAVLLTRINSDLPGMIVARVRQNVYDSVHGTKLVIPMGSTLVGYYGSKIFAGQTRVLSSFNKIIFPNGSTVDLKGMTASDAYGQAGMHANVNNHYLEMFGASFLIAALSTVLPSTSNVTVVGGGLSSGGLESSGGSALNQVSQKALNRAINIPPTLIVHRGFRFNVMVNKPIRLGINESPQS